MLFLKKSVYIVTIVASQALLVSPIYAQNSNYETLPPSSPPVIRTISIQVRDVFEGKDLGMFYRGVNQLKVSTRKEIIKRELFFREGDFFEQFALDESERNIRRELPFVHKVSITPSFDGDYVDILVSVKDTWTLIPVVNFSSGSGTSHKSAGLIESNVLGYGKRAELLYAQENGREEIEGVWDDTRVWGSFDRFTAAYFDRSDGHIVLASFGHPFRTLLDKYSWNVSVSDSDTVERLYENGTERFVFGQKRTEFDSNYAVSRGNPEVRLHRFLFGYSYLDYRFSEATDNDFNNIDLNPDSVSRDPSLLAADRRFSGPYLGYENIVPDYISINYVDRFALVEDFNLGEVFSLRAGFAPTVLGSLENTLLLSARGAKGWRFSSRSFSRLELTADSRLHDTVFNNSVFTLRSSYYNSLGPRFLRDFYLGNHTIAASAVFDYANRLDRDSEFLLGADRGLRGYKAGTFTGNKRMRFNLEERFHVINDLLKLVSIGGAVFLDAGSAGSGNYLSLAKNDFYADIGFGLRFNFPRSTGSRVLRVDFAYPLRDGPDGSGAFELRLILKGGQAFSSRLRSDIGLEKTGIDAGL